MSMNINGEQYTTFTDYMETSVSEAEREQVSFEADLICKLIEAREQLGLTQRDLAALSGVKQPAIARLEKMHSTPQINTLFKLLCPLGYTLAIVPMDAQQKH